MLYLGENAGLDAFKRIKQSVHWLNGLRQSGWHQAWGRVIYAEPPHLKNPSRQLLFIKMVSPW